jgi:hypothetical protein
MVIVKIRELTQAQIMACGEFSLIQTMADKIKQKKLKRHEIVAYAEQQHTVARAALVSPTYDEIIERIGNGINIDARKTELAELKKKVEGLTPGPQRSALEEEIDSYRIWIDLILPDDFLGTIVAYSLGYNKSDIKLITEKMLLEAAWLAEKGHDNPHDHVGSGTFTDFNKYDIDRRAWMVLDDYRAEVKAGA